MCLILFAYDAHPKYQLVVLANRDEFYERPTRQADWWEENPEILAGKDLQAGGTWMGVNQKGHFAALTNYREPQNIDKNAPSRGALVTDFLSGKKGAGAFMDTIFEEKVPYNGFNLLTKDGNELYHFSNRSGKPQKVAAGIHGLSNALLNTSWPKVDKGKEKLESLLASSPVLDMDEAFKALYDPEIASDEALPATGVPLEWERLLSAMYIDMAAYGTRCSTVLTVDRQGAVFFEERSYVPKNEAKRFEF